MCNDPELHELYEKYLLLSSESQVIAKRQIREVIDSLLEQEERNEK